MDSKSKPGMLISGCPAGEPCMLVLPLPATSIVPLALPSKNPSALGIAGSECGRGNVDLDPLVSCLMSSPVISFACSFLILACCFNRLACTLNTPSDELVRHSHKKICRRDIIVDRAPRTHSLR
jgi:hypothetical protein